MVRLELARRATYNRLWIPTVREREGALYEWIPYEDSMDSHVTEDATFRCPVCEETLKVNASMREALVERGCVVCGADLTPDAFSDD
jgi:hypothetical protein